MKKVFRILFLGIISLFAAITVNAATTGGSITIDRQGKTNYETKYNAYRILDLSYDEDNDSYAYTLNAKWRDFFTTGAGKDYVVIDREYVTIKSGADAAELAKKALAYAQAIDEDAFITLKEGTNTGKISNLKLGYYLVDSSLGTLCSLNSTAKDVTINEKNAEPSIEKTATTPVEGTAKIGDKVDYKIVVNVAAGYQKYVVTDKMTAGLTFNNDITIKYYDAEGNELTGLTGAATNTTASTNYTFKIDFSNVNLANVAKIEITYSATINENAVDNNRTQSNEAKLSFGNNSNTTSSTKTITTYEALFSKVSNKKIDDKNIELDGAEFKLYDAKNGGKEIKVVKVSEGAYRVATAEEIENNEVVKFIVGGKVTIKGLAKDTSYYLEETKAPDGYTKLAERYEIKAGTNEVSMVVNTSGVVLPTTGGIGTTLFVLIGTIMVLSLGTVLVSKYRMTKFNA